MKVIILISLLIFMPISRALGADPIQIDIHFAQLESFTNILPDGSCENAVIVNFKVVTNTSTRVQPVTLSFGGNYRQISPVRSLITTWEIPRWEFSDGNPTIEMRWSTGNLDLNCDAVLRGRTYKWVLNEFIAKQGTVEKIPPLPSSALVSCE